ncbi:MAG: hypothetical protein RL336_2120 [Pseudomonadota bacterium]|jgi:uncharacterized Rmd1/YagE family protein
MNEIQISLLGRSIDPDMIEKVLIEQLGAVRYRDAYYIASGDGEGWLFDYGVLVTWRVNYDQRMALLEAVAPIVVDPVEMVVETYQYQIDSASGFAVRDDVLTLPDDEPLTRLALSHAFAQETKLEFFENVARDVIQNNMFVSKELARTGKVPLSRRELSRLRGVLFDTSTDITWQFNLLDTPEFFWSYPELEGLYNTLSKYLDIGARLTILNTKLATIHEMLDMLAEEQRHKHSAFLEWIIIVLIAVDIVIYMLPGH